MEVFIMSFTFYPDPRCYRGISRLHDDIDNLFGRFFTSDSTAASGTGTPVMDVTSDEKAYTLKIELPGVAPDAVSVRMDGSTLIVSGEKKQEETDEKTRKHVTERIWGSFERTVTLPDDADTDAVTASARDGVLTVTVPRRAPEKPAVRSITVQQA